MKILSTALLAAGLVSLSACGGGAANNTAGNNTAEPPADLNAPAPNLNAPAPDLNAPAPAPVDANASTNETNSAGNAH